jgi:hypothetical protein
MGNKIDQKIVGWKVKSNSVEEEPLKVVDAIEIPTLSINTQRGEELKGSTYKIKASADLPAWYITIANIEVGGITSPYEIFISTKDMGNFEWTSAITRLLSAVFRRGGDVSFLVEELQAIHNPKGGYWGNSHEGKKKKYYNSILNELGTILKIHLDGLAIQNNHVCCGKCEESTSLTTLVLDTEVEEVEIIGGNYPVNATVCPTCKAKAVVKMDSCDTCLECGYSKCS